MTEQSYLVGSKMSMKHWIERSLCQTATNETAVSCREYNHVPSGKRLVHKHENIYLSLLSLPQFSKHIFDPFFTLRSRVRGELNVSGLLSVALLYGAEGHWGSCSFSHNGIYELSSVDSSPFCGRISHGI